MGPSARVTSTNLRVGNLGPWILRCASFWQTVILVVILLGIGAYSVPAHWSSIWADLEFSGPVAPIANRIAAGQQLYEDGAHIPLPPLPFMIVYWFTGGDAVWRSESLLNWFFQSLALLLIYVGLSRAVAAPIPFLAALGATPIFFSLRKMVVYDSATQAAVALIAAGSAAFVVPREPAEGTARPGAPGAGTRFTWLPLLAAGVATAAALLCKQSTAVGAAGGVCLLLLCCSRGTLADSFRSLAFYLTSTAVAFAGFCLLLAPHMSVGGMITDVFVAGAEPKGGSEQLSSNLMSYAGELRDLLSPGELAAALVLGLIGSLPWKPFPAPGSEAAPDWAFESLPWRNRALAGAGLGGAVVGFVAILRFSGPIPWSTAFSPLVGFLPTKVLSVGLFLGALVSVVQLASRVGRIGGLSPPVSAVAAFFFVTFAAAVFHSLSVTTFRWTYDNNPLIVIALAAFFLLLSNVIDRLLPWVRISRVVLQAVAVMVIQFALWTTVGAQVRAVQACTETWPEVGHLAGARMTPSAQGMRDLVQVVRRFAPHPTDEVLLLPEDPGVEAWFDRPRPHLTSAIIFSDQYWDRYVAVDYARLEQNPPAIIIIGPHHWGRWVAGLWSQSALHLMQRIETQLLPHNYRLASARPIHLARGDERMEVYVRNDLFTQSFRPFLPGAAPGTR